MAVQKTIVAAIDPGLTSGGMVFVDARAEEVLAAKSYVLTPKKRAASATALPNVTGDKKFAQADLLAVYQAGMIIEDFKAFSEEHGQPKVLVIESFVDQRSRAREEKARLLKDRWKTPLMMGHLSAGLAALGYSADRGNLIYQDAGYVIRQYNFEISTLKSRGKKDKDVVITGDRLVTSDHTRKALAHALWRISRLSEVQA